MFMERFPDKNLSKTRLQNIYKKHRIRWKRIKVTKVPDQRTIQRIKKKAKEAREKLLTCI